MGKSEGNANDGKAAAYPGESVKNGKPEPCENDPQKVDEAGAGNSFFADKPTVNQFLSEGEGCKTGNPECRLGKRNAYDCECHQQTEQYPEEPRDDASTENEPQ